MQRKILKQKIKFVKKIYGEENFKECKTLQFGDTILVGWYVCGYPTLEKLEAEFSDEQILELHSQSGIRGGFV